MTAPDLWPMSLAALLAVLLAAEVIAPPPRAAPAVAVHEAAAPAAATADDDPAAARATILARPLFRPDRRPPRATPVIVDQTVPRLSAIVITGAGRGAIFIDDGGSAAVLRVGGRIGAYQVQAIAPDSVRLSGPNGEISVHPTFAAAPAPAPTATAAAPPTPPPATGLFAGPPSSGRFSDMPQ